MGRRRVVVVVLSAVALVVALAVRMTVYDGFDWPDALEFELRGLRALAALAVGIALASSGVLLQATMRNDLASPWVLGLTAGAGLGVAVWLYAVHSFGLAGTALATPVAPALIGACGVLGVVYALGHRGGVLDPPTLILVGVMVGVMCGALTGFIQHLMPGVGLEAYVRWMLGELNEGASTAMIVGVLVLGVVGVGLSAWLGPALDAASLGDDEAVSVGVNLKRLRLSVLLLAGVMTGATILIAGPIGFVGLVCPHVARMGVGGANRWVVVVAALLGGALLVGADALVAVARTDAGRVPIGVVTALVGAPVFIAMLQRRGVRGGGAA